ncbi:MAG TPA: DNA primase DnaG [Methanocorpusculum sp.]|mgnify:FL=1|nr:DNA primase DnaG [Methanocorpusculum sp.]
MYLSDTTKYLIHIKIEAEGVVEKTDVVGAIFGQTEGLLGEDMDLRDLQRSGRVGRIDVTLTSKHGKTAGDLYIASSLDRAETAILAAALETIERIGPCVSRISVEGIEDLRAIKRRKIVDRAKELLMESFDEVGLSTNEILAEVREASRVVKITAIGDDRLPAGPTVLESDAIIILEGRADVLNLLRCGIKNTVAVEGTKVPEIVAELSRKKNTTVFVDGDRGGDLILKELLQVADVDFVAFSPRGRSVEDMTRKEIIKSLRNKVPADVVRAQVARNEPLSDLVFEITAPEDEADPASQALPAVQEAEVLAAEEKPEPREAISSVEGHADYMKGTGRARVLNSDAVILGDYTIKELEDILPKLDSDAAGIIMDASCGQKLGDSAYKKGLKYIAAREFTGIVHRPAGIRLIPL